MSILQFYLCAIPKPFWETAIDSIDIARFAVDAAGCEKRIVKGVNLDNENVRYTLLCQQLVSELIFSGYARAISPQNTFETILSNKQFPAKQLHPGYFSLLTRVDETTDEWRLGASFFLPDDVSDHLSAFLSWVANQDFANAQFVQERIEFLEQAIKFQCGIVEVLTGFHSVDDEDLQFQETYGAVTGSEDTNEQHFMIPDFVVSGSEIETFDSATKKKEAMQLRRQILNALRTGDPVSFGSQAKNDVITEVLNDFVFVPQEESLHPVNLRVIYADGSEAEPFPIFCLHRKSESSLPQSVPVRMALMSMRHLELDRYVDYCWFRNREVSRTRTLAETDNFCFKTTIAQISEAIELGDLYIHLYHTGFEPAVIGFYRGVVQTLLNIRMNSNSPSLIVVPQYYYHDDDDPYQSGRVWE